MGRERQNRKDHGEEPIWASVSNADSLLVGKMEFGHLDRAYRPCETVDVAMAAGKTLGAQSMQAVAFWELVGMGITAMT